VPHTNSIMNPMANQAPNPSPRSSRSSSQGHFQVKHRRRTRVVIGPIVPTLATKSGASTVPCPDDASANHEPARRAGFDEYFVLRTRVTAHRYNRHIVPGKVIVDEAALGSSFAGWPVDVGVRHLHGAHLDRWRATRLHRRVHRRLQPARVLRGGISDPDSSVPARASSRDALGTPRAVRLRVVTSGMFVVGAATAAESLYRLVKNSGGDAGTGFAALAVGVVLHKGASGAS
jgi:hypothetical protein